MTALLSEIAKPIITVNQRAELRAASAAPDFWCGRRLSMSLDIVRPGQYIRSGRFGIRVSPREPLFVSCLEAGVDVVERGRSTGIDDAWPALSAAPFRHQYRGLGAPGTTVVRSHGDAVASVWTEIGRADHLGPFLPLIDDEVAEILARERKGGVSTISRRSSSPEVR
jgi:hypothetical protein